MFSKRNLQIIACCLASVFATLCFVGWQMQKLTGSAAESLKFLRAMYVIKHNFDGEVDNAKLFDGAIDGMVKALDDPYTVYLDKKAFADLSEATIGSFGGIGIVCRYVCNTIVVVYTVVGIVYTFIDIVRVVQLKVLYYIVVTYLQPKTATFLCILDYCATTLVAKPGFAIVGIVFVTF